MNERFKLLAEQAGLHDVVLTAMGIDEDVTAFAELIVKECMQQVEGQYKPILEDAEMMKEPQWDGYVQCGVDSYVAIREHFFGIEE